MRSDGWWSPINTFVASCEAELTTEQIYVNNVEFENKI